MMHKTHIYQISSYVYAGAFSQHAKFLGQLTQPTDPVMPLSQEDFGYFYGIIHDHGRVCSGSYGRTSKTDQAHVHSILLFMGLIWLYRTVYLSYHRGLSEAKALQNDSSPEIQSSKDHDSHGASIYQAKTLPLILTLQLSCRPPSFLQLVICPHPSLRSALSQSSPFSVIEKITWLKLYKFIAYQRDSLTALCS